MLESLGSEMEQDGSMVTLSLANNKFIVKRDKLQQTEYYKTSMDMFDSEIPVPAGVTQSALFDYLQFFDSEPKKKRQRLKECFLHYFLIGDVKYLHHCVKKLLKHYWDYKVMLNELNQDLQREIYLNIPWVYVPDNFKNNETFLNDWIKNICMSHKNKCMLIQDEYSRGERNKYFHWVKYYENSNPERLESLIKKYYAEKTEGYDIQIKFYDNGVKSSQQFIGNGGLCGIQKGWYRTGTLQSEAYYCRGEQHGPSRSWYESGRKRSESNYIDGSSYGDYIIYFDTPSQEIKEHVFIKGNGTHTTLIHKTSPTQDN